MKTVKVNFIFWILILAPLLISGQNNKVKNSNFFNELTEEERSIIVGKGTERAWSGEYVAKFDTGVYLCKACNNPLFLSISKFRSNCGWPSFDDEINGALIRIEDNTLGMNRVEICCSNCTGHLGHVFEGENLTEKNIRHCVNSLSIKFFPIN